MDKFNPKEPLTEFTKEPSVAFDKPMASFMDDARKAGERLDNIKLGLAAVLTIEQLPTEDGQNVLGMGLDDLGKLLKRNLARIGHLTTQGQTMANGYACHTEFIIDGKRIKGVAGLPRHPHIVYEDVYKPNNKKEKQNDRD